MTDTRRKSPRIKISLKAKDSESGEDIGDVKDISITGCFIETDSLKDLDSVIDMKFLGCSELEDISIRGRIVSHRSGPSGMGIEFYAMPEEYRTALRGFIKKEMGTVQITDRRRAKRVELAFSVYNHSGERLGITKNISADGFLLRTDSPLDENTEYDIKFTLPNIKKLISAKATVKRVEDRAFAMTFSYIHPQDRFDLDALVNDLTDEIII